MAPRIPANLAANETLRPDVPVFSGLLVILFAVLIPHLLSKIHHLAVHFALHRLLAFFCPVHHAPPLVWDFEYIFSLASPWVTP